MAFELITSSEKNINLFLYKILFTTLFYEIKRKLTPTDIHLYKNTPALCYNF